MNLLVTGNAIDNFPIDVLEEFVKEFLPVKASKIINILNGPTTTALAARLGIQHVFYKTENEKYPELKLKDLMNMRNSKIAKDIDFALIIWNGKSHNLKLLINYIKAAGKRIMIYNVKEGHFV